MEFAWFMLSYSAGIGAGFGVLIMCGWALYTGVRLLLVVSDWLVLKVRQRLFGEGR